jgi:RNA polymerase sigma factor (sigma-70 family)
MSRCVVPPCRQEEVCRGRCCGENCPHGQNPQRPFGGALLQEKGWTQADFARAVGVDATRVSLWMQMKAIPKTPAMRQRIEQATGKLFEDLFPPELERLTPQDVPRDLVVIREVPIERLLTSARVPRIASPEDAALAQEPLRLLAASLADLPPRHRTVLELRWGLGGHDAHTLAEIAERFGVTHQRIRGIEMEALRMLQTPSRHRSGVTALHAWRRSAQPPGD